MSCSWTVLVWPVSVLSMVLTAADNPAWKGKEIAQWSDDDIRQVLTDSPWAEKVTPTINPAARSNQSRGGGFGYPGGIGFPGGRRGGLGYPGGGYPGGGGRPPADSGDSDRPVTLTLRWESAFPIHEAELRAHDNNAPTLDEDHYALAVYGVPSRMAGGDSQSLAGRFKKHASIKRDGQKDLKPSSVQVLQRDNGLLVVYLFPKSKKITQADRRLQFAAQIGRLEFTQSFYTDDMVYQGKFEL